MHTDRKGKQISGFQFYPRSVLSLDASFTQVRKVIIVYHHQFYCTITQTSYIGLH